jgi:hypothetical protein
VSYSWGASLPVSEALAPIERAYTEVLQRQLVTSVGVAPNLLAELSDADVGYLLVYAGSLEDVSKWTVADLLVWAEQRAATNVGTTSGREFWDARDRLWDEILANCKMDVGKHAAYNMAATARAFPWERRRHTATLSFEHHRLVSSREEDEQEHWLDMAEDGEWSVRKMRARFYGGGDPLLPKVTVMSTSQPRELWPIQRVEREVYDAFALPTRYDTVQRIIEVVQQIKDELQRAA